MTKMLVGEDKASHAASAIMALKTSHRKFFNLSAQAWFTWKPTSQIRSQNYERSYDYSYNWSDYNRNSSYRGHNRGYNRGRGRGK